MPNQRHETNRERPHRMIRRKRFPTMQRRNIGMEHRMILSKGDIWSRLTHEKSKEKIQSPPHQSCDHSDTHHQSTFTIVRREREKNSHHKPSRQTENHPFGAGATKSVEPFIFAQRGV